MSDKHNKSESKGHRRPAPSSGGNGQSSRPAANHPSGLPNNAQQAGHRGSTRVAQGRATDPGMFVSYVGVEPAADAYGDLGRVDASSVPMAGSPRDPLSPPQGRLFPSRPGEVTAIGTAQPQTDPRNYRVITPVAPTATEAADRVARERALALAARQRLAANPNMQAYLANRDDWPLYWRSHGGRGGDQGR